MPHTRSAKKHGRKDEKRRLHNRSVKKAIKVEIKKYLELAKEGKTAELEKELVVAYKKLDTAAAKRIIHPNAAARKKSQLARMLGAQKRKPAAAKA